MLATDLYVDDNSIEKLPGYHQVFRTLRTRSDYKFSIALTLHELDGWLGTDVSKLRMRYPSKVRFHIFQHYFFFVFFFFAFNDWLVFFFDLEPILIQVNVGMNRFYNGRETDSKAVMSHVLVSICVLFVREIQSHLYFKQLLFFRRLFLPVTFFVEGKSNENSSDDGSFLVHFFVLFRGLARRQSDITK